jgi:NAD(P)-dependent dehydrogenase (short-subunit alcohol dehydrogenase family)
MNTSMLGKVALVTGGSSGIGRATAVAFANEGATVVIASRRQAVAEDALRVIRQAGGSALWIEADVSQAAPAKAMVEQTLATFGRLDYACNNAGSAAKAGRTAEIDEDAWDRTINGYLKSVWLCMKYEIPAMLQTGAGVIINNASVDGLRAYPFPIGSAYAAAKHGVIGLTKSAALEYIAQGIRINAICPGWVRTPPVERWMTQDPAIAQQILAQEPIGRLGTPEEIAEAVLWLCSDRASFVVGAALAVDGGYLA